MVSSCAQSVKNSHILSEVHTNKQTNHIPHCLHEHVIDGKLHQYNMFTAINLDNYPWELCVCTYAAH